MKTTLWFVALASGLLLPAVTHADPSASPGKTKKTVKTATVSRAADTKAAAAKENPKDFILAAPVTGSHIPAVWHSYGGHVMSSSDLRVYNENDLNRAGQLDVASELTFVDPSLRLGRGR